MTYDLPYNGELSWAKSRTIYATVYGSRAYGTSLPTSDTDIRGIMIAPKEYYLGYNKVCEQAEQKKDPDMVIFELRKFMKLSTDANPNALELLFTDPEDHLIRSPLCEPLFENRDLFLSKRLKHTLSGYAMSQLKRINLHWRFINNPIKEQPKRATFGLPERTLIPADQLAAAQSAIKKQMDTWSWRDLEDLDASVRQAIKDEFFRKLLEITQWSYDSIEERLWGAAVKHLGFTTNFIELLDKERKYNNAMKDWRHYQEWLAKRNKERAALEAKFGYDAKFALHLVRLMTTGQEVLSGQGYKVRRPDAKFLLEIRNGLWTYEELVTWAEKKDAELTELAKTSKLPHSPDVNKLDEICQSLVERSFSWPF